MTLNFIPDDRQAKTGLSSLALKRALGVSDPTAWRMHHKLMQAMAERETLYTLAGQVQVDDAYLGGELTGAIPSLFPTMPSRITSISSVISS